MQYKPLLAVALVAVFICSAAFAAEEEKITLSTYYPAPYGVYEELFVTGALQSGNLGPSFGIDSIITAEQDGDELTAVHIRPDFQNGPGVTDPNSIKKYGLLVDAGDIGIGTTSPEGRLHLKYAMTTTGRYLIMEGKSPIPMIPIFFIDWRNVDEGASYIAARIASFNTGATDDGDLRFYTTSDTVISEQMRIDKDGNIGINEISPKSKLHVTGLPEYADNDAAKAGGLTAGAFYRTPDNTPAFGDSSHVCVVY